MSTKRVLMAAAAATLAGASYANAQAVVPPVLSVQLQYVGAFSSPTANTAATPINGVAPTNSAFLLQNHPGTTLRYKFNVLLSLTDARPITTAVLGTAAFNFGLNQAGGSNLTPNSATSGSNIPYNGTLATYLTDTSDTGSAAPIFFSNKDGGTNFDLQAILVALNDAGTAFDRHIGEAPRPDPQWGAAGEGDDGLGYPSNIGTVNVLWDGVGTPTLNSNANGIATFLAEYVTGGIQENESNAQFLGGTVQFGAIPEPTALATLGLAGLGMARRRRA